MSDSSDGEATNRHFSNIQKNDASDKIVGTTEFQKYCYNLIYVHHDINIAELKRNLNTGDSFRSQLQIPKKTIIEVNTFNDEKGMIINFLFQCSNRTKNEHVVAFYLRDDLIEQCTQCYKTNLAQGEMNNLSMVNISPTISTGLNDTRLTEKIDELIKQVNKLTDLLVEQREENTRLKHELEALKGEQTYKRKKTVQGGHSSRSLSAAGSEVSEQEMQIENESNTNEMDNKNTNQKSAPLLETNMSTRTMRTQQKSLNEPVAQTTKQTTTKDKNIPPIVVFDTDQKRMGERITSRQICTPSEYYFVRVNKSKYRIHANTLAQYDKILELLNEFKIKYHTYTPSERKEIHVLFKHIPMCYDESEVLLFMERDHGLVPKRLTKFATKHMRENCIESSIWHASFEPKTDKKKIYGVKHIGNQYGIIVEELKNKTVTQCRRCWRFEHTISNCTYDHRCNKCLATHGEGECTLDFNKSLRPSCVNCKKENHEATSKECPIYLRIAERRSNAGNKTPKQNTVSNNTSTSHTSTSNNTASFAETVRGGEKRTAKNNVNMETILKQLLAQQNQLNNFIMQIAPHLLNSRNG